MQSFKHFLAKSMTVVMTLAVVAPMMLQSAQAAQFIDAGLVFSNVTASNAANGTDKIYVYFKLNTVVANLDTMTVTFTGATSMTSTAGDYVISTASLPLFEGVAATAAPISTTPVADGTAHTVQLTFNGAGDTTTLYGFSITPGVNKFTNPAAGQLMTMATSVGDSTNVWTSFIPNATINVTATVNPYFSLSLTSFTQSLGSISQGPTNLLTKGSGTTVTVTSNSINGWTSQIVDNNGGLKSGRDATAHGGRTAITDAAIGAATAANSLAASSKGLFGVQVANGTGSTITANYTTTNAGGINAETVAGLASNSLAEVAYRTDVSNATTGDTFTINPTVVTTAITPAATDYTDNIRVTAAGLF